MTTKARSNGGNKAGQSEGTNGAPESGTMPAAARAPAEVLREAKAKIAEAEKVEIPRMPKGRHPASDAAEEMGRARKTVEDIRISLTLKDVCNVISAQIDPADFASTALHSLSVDVVNIEPLVLGTRPDEAWGAIYNVVERMKLASRVAHFLDSGEMREDDSTDEAEAAE